MESGVVGGLLGYIVHALYDMLEGLDARTRFEYVRSEADVVDLPSKVEMSDMIFDLAGRCERRVDAWAALGAGAVCPSRGVWEQVFSQGARW